ncbi:MAG: hypothetical protein ACR2QR_00400 [Woeseiaceae bacterium]
MEFLKKKFVVALGILMLCGTATANDDIWFGVKVGTLGLGAEAAWRPLEWLDVRAGANFYDYDDSGSQAGINYNGKLALDTYYVTGNFHFPLSPFRLTAGAFANNNEVQLTSVDTPSFLIGDNPVPYTADEIGTLRSVAHFDSFAPYVGAGFDFDVMDRFGLSLDFGVLLQGDPTIVTTADGLLAQDPGLIDDLNAETQELLDEIDDLKAYPVVSLGFNFNF